MHETQCKASLRRSRGRQASREAGRYPGPVQGAAGIQREGWAEEKEMMSGDTEDNHAEGGKKARERNWQGKKETEMARKKVPLEPKCREYFICSFLTVFC